MPISALSESTIRLLGSPVVITSAVDLVKELVENAIDAKATAIEVLISTNTIDRIEVRDNGQGILPDDYESLCRRGHTSKLSSFEDLRTVGGKTLGFRGEALASANVLSKVIITTRTSECPTAAKLHILSDGGGVAKQERTSAPVGTTVCVTGLFSRVPVREQVAIKEAKKNLAKTRDVLHAYALAKPQIRLSLKVLQNPIHSWSYSPRSEAGVKEAALQVFGADLASQCLLRTIPAQFENPECQIDSSEEDITIEAFLPKPDANPLKISKGAFFSVDSRPVSTARGTMKKLFSIFKTHLAKSLKLGDGPKSLKDPFIRVDIRCFPGSYDPNIEPSKNEVLFTEEQKLLDLFERLCMKLYNTEKGSDACIENEPHPLLLQTQTPPLSSDGPEVIEARPELGLPLISRNQQYQAPRIRLPDEPVRSIRPLEESEPLSVQGLPWHNGPDVDAQNRHNNTPEVHAPERVSPMPQRSSQKRTTFRGDGRLGNPPNVSSAVSSAPMPHRAEVAGTQ